MKNERRHVEIMRKVEPRFSSVQLAREWYEFEPLPGFAGATAMQLVSAGRGDEVLDYIDAIDSGIHA